MGTLFTYAKIFMLVLELLESRKTSDAGVGVMYLKIEGAAANDRVNHRPPTRQTKLVVFSTVRLQRLYTISHRVAAVR